VSDGSRPRTRSRVGAGSRLGSGSSGPVHPIRSGRSSPRCAATRRRCVANRSTVRFRAHSHPTRRRQGRAERVVRAAARV